MSRLVRSDEKEHLTKWDYMRVRCAAYLLAYDGRAHLKQLRMLLRHHGVQAGSIPADEGGSKGSHAGRMLARVMQELREDGLAVRDGDYWTVPSLPDLAEWLADQIDKDYDPLPPVLVGTSWLERHDAIESVSA